MSSATLQIVRHAPPWEWTWRLRDSRGEIVAEARLSPAAASHQMLLEREALARRMPGDRLRDEMTAHMRALLKDELAEALETSPARTLTVAGPRPTQIALSLPFELLFGRDDPGAIVVRKVLRPRRHAAVPLARGERMVTAFPLTAEQHYLPLHLEAELLAEHARRAGMALDELFVCFSGEDLLRATRGASIVHLAGHGTEGALLCEWRDRQAVALASGDLVELWRDESPRLVVLGFCESSSERDDLRSTRIAAYGEITLKDYAARVATTALTPSSSMALDLVASLPAAVIGMRTNADDTEARRFLDAFYGAHLREGLGVERAYGAALAECGFLDGVGLPVPALYVGGEGEALAESKPAGRSGPVRCLTPRQRRRLNTLYKATSPLGRVIGERWACRVTGGDRHLRSELAAALLVAVEGWRSVQGMHGPCPTLGINEVEGVAWEIFSRPVVGPHSALPAMRVDLDRWPGSVTTGEVLSARSHAPLHELVLLGRATCDVPALVDAVLANGVDAVAGDLAERVGGAVLDDWELALELLDLLPDEDVAAIRCWAEDRWRTVEAIGQTAIDVLAAFAILSEDERLLDSDQGALYAIGACTGVSGKEQSAALKELAESGIASLGTGVFGRQAADMLSCDRMTVQHGWHLRSSGAARALAECQVERELASLPSIDMVESLATPDLARIAELCVECGHPRLDSLLEELAKRDDGRERADALRQRTGIAEDDGASAQPAGREEDPRWGAWDESIQAARFEDAAALLDKIESAGMPTDHPLRIAASRLVTRIAEPDQERLLQDARALEERIVDEAPTADRTIVQTELLLVVRQAAASALQRLNRPDEAGNVLLDHFHETVNAGSRPRACAYAGVHAIRMLCLQGDADRAQPVLDVLAPLVAGLKVSSVTVLVHTAEVELLVAEGRRVHAAAAAEDLLREIGEWEQPRPDQVRAALAACTPAFVPTARGIALFALIDMTGRTPDMLDDERMPHFAHAGRELTSDEIVAEAEELFARMPVAMGSLGLSASDVHRGAREFAEGFLRLSEGPAEVRLLGARGAAIVTARAGAGCPLSARILHAARASSADGPDAVDLDTEGLYDAAAIARDHPRLKDALAGVLPEGIKVVLPLLTDVLNGDREARLVWSAVMLDESDDAGGPRALMAIARGDVRGAWSALSRHDGLPSTASVCVAIEECCLWEHDEDRPRSAIPDDLVSVALTSWEAVLDQAAVDQPSANAAYMGLASAFGSMRVLLAGLLVARHHDTSLIDVGAVEAEEVVTRRVFELLWERPETQLSLAELTIAHDPERSDEAFDLLQALASSERFELAAHAKVARLAGAVSRRRDKLTELALDEVLDCLEEIDADSHRRIPVLNVAAVAALVLDRPGVAVAVAGDLLAHPAVRAMPQLRYGAFAVLFRCLMADGRSPAAAQMLAEAGIELGFSAACAILAQEPTALDPALAPRFTDVVLPLADGSDPLTGSAQLRSALMTFMELTVDLDAWASVRRTVAERLEEE